MRGHHLFTEDGQGAKGANKGRKAEFHARVEELLSVMFRLVLGH